MKERRKMTKQTKTQTNQSIAVALGPVCWERNWLSKSSIADPENRKDSLISCSVKLMTTGKTNENWRKDKNDMRDERLHYRVHYSSKTTNIRKQIKNFGERKRIVFERQNRRFNRNDSTSVLKENFL
jgi:hypothetical protein